MRQGLAKGCLYPLNPVKTRLAPSRQIPNLFQPHDSRSEGQRTLQPLDDARGARLDGALAAAPGGGRPRPAHPHRVIPGFQLVAVAAVT